MHVSGAILAESGCFSRKLRSAPHITGNGGFAGAASRSGGLTLCGVQIRSGRNQRSWPKPPPAPIQPAAPPAEKPEPSKLDLALYQGDQSLCRVPCRWLPENSIFPEISRY